MEVKPLRQGSVPAGYKQTEIGVIPEDWKVESLSSISKEPMQNGLFFKPALKGAGVKLINVGDLYTHVPIYSGALELFDATEVECERFKVKDGDLFFTRSSVVASGIAHCNIYRSPKAESVVFDSHVIRVRPDPKKVAPSYLFRFCISSIARHYLVSHAKTATMTTIDQSVLGKCPVLLPPHEEQESIAEALSDADALIESLEQLLSKKRQVKQGAMQELLTGKKRLLGLSGEWGVKRLGDVCRITTGKKDVNEGNPEGQFPFFTCSRSHTFSDSYSFDTEAILIAGNGEVGNLHYFKGKFEAYQRTYVLSQFFGHVGYLWQQLSAYLAESLGLGKIGSSIPYIKMENLVGFEFSSPQDEPEQTAIAAILSDMDAEIAAMEAKLAKARQLKQGMMQELLTGRIRLVRPSESGSSRPC